MSYLEELLREAVRKGEFDNLPGAGRPLKLEDDPYTPEHLRLAHKLLKDNDLAPDWIMQAKAVDAARAAWVKELQAAHQTRQVKLAEAERRPRPTLERATAQAAWETVVAGLREQAGRLNKTLLAFNLKLPRGVTHRPLIDVDAEIARLG